jgi:ectoine hydroxylase-related dioxygenase (phytanoyl-CoA dioxygenase family)
MSTSTNDCYGHVVDAYRSNGYYFALRALESQEAVSLRRRLEAFEASQGGPIKPEHRQKPHLLFTWLADLVRDPRILDVIEAILGPDILVWQTTLFIKEARDERFVSWHQDSTYWGLSEPEVVTAWVALSPSTLESGCVKVIPGTHVLDQVPHVETRAEANMLTRGQEIAVDVDERRAVAMPLRPGEMSLHHIRTFHSSEPNRSNERRIGLAIRYIPTRIRQTAVRGDSATLVRGRDQYGNFELERSPERDFAAETVDYHRSITQRRRAIYAGAASG